MILDSRLTKQAYHLIHQFLLDHDLQQTAQMLESETSHCERELADIVMENVPLIEMIQQYNHSNAPKELAKLSLNGSWLQVDPSPPLSLTNVCSDIHHSNILCGVHGTLPTDGSATLVSDLPIIISGSTDKTMKLTNALNGHVLYSFDCFSAAVLSVCIHPEDPVIILASSMDGSAVLLDIRSKSLIQRWTDHTKYVNRAIFSQDGQYIITGSYDKTINIYQKSLGGYEWKHRVVFEGAVECIISVPPKDDNVYSVAVGVRDSNYLYYVSLTETFPTCKFNMNANGDDWVSFSPLDMSLSPSNSHLLIYTDSLSGRLLILPVWSSIIVKELYGTQVDPFSQPRCCWDATGGSVFATSDDFMIYRFATKTGQVLQKLQGHEAIVRSLEFSNHTLVSTSYDKTIRLWSERE